MYETLGNRLWGTEGEIHDVNSMVAQAFYAEVLSGLQGREGAPSTQLAVHCSLPEWEENTSEPIKTLGQKMSLLLSKHALVASHFQKKIISYALNASLLTITSELFPSTWFSHLEVPRASEPPGFSSNNPGSFPYFSFSWNSFPKMALPPPPPLPCHYKHMDFPPLLHSDLHSILNCMDGRPWPPYMTYFLQLIILCHTPYLTLLLDARSSQLSNAEPSTMQALGAIQHPCSRKSAYTLQWPSAYPLGFPTVDMKIAVIFIVFIHLRTHYSFVYWVFFSNIYNSWI